MSTRIVKRPVGLRRTAYAALWAAGVISLSIFSAFAFSATRLTPCTERVGSTLDAVALVVEEAQVVVHEADQPDVNGYLPNADGLTGEHLAEIDFASTEARAAALRDDDRAVVERSRVGRTPHNDVVGWYGRFPSSTSCTSKCGRGCACASAACG